MPAAPQAPPPSNGGAPSRRGLFFVPKHNFCQRQDLVCEVEFRPHGRPKGFPIALGNLRAPFGWRNINLFVERTFFTCGKVYLQGCRPKGSRGRSESPLVAPGKTSQMSKISFIKTPRSPKDFGGRVKGQCPLRGAGAEPLLGCGAKPHKQESRGRSPLAGMSGAAPPTGVQGRRPARNHCNKCRRAREICDLCNKSPA